MLSVYQCRKRLNELRNQLLEGFIEQDDYHHQRAELEDYIRQLEAGIQPEPSTEYQEIRKALALEYALARAVAERDVRTFLPVYEGEKVIFAGIPAWVKWATTRHVGLVVGDKTFSMKRKLLLGRCKKVRGEVYVI